MKSQIPHTVWCCRGTLGSVRVDGNWSLENDVVVVYSRKLMESVTLVSSCRCRREQLQSCGRDNPYSPLFWQLLPAQQRKRLLFSLEPPSLYAVAWTVALGRFRLDGLCVRTSFSTVELLWSVHLLTVYPSGILGDRHSKKKSPRAVRLQMPSAGRMRDFYIRYPIQLGLLRFVCAESCPPIVWIGWTFPLPCILYQIVSSRTCSTIMDNPTESNLVLNGNPKLHGADTWYQYWLRWLTSVHSHRRCYFV